MSSCLKSRCNFIAQKWVFTILASIGLGLQSSSSVMMSITIIEMVVRTESLEEQHNLSCPNTNNVTSANKTIFNSQIEDRTSVERYPWDEYTQGIILSSFSWSCALAQFFYGTLSERFGGKHIFGLGTFSQAVLTFITPLIIGWGGCTALIITRVLIGLATDGMFAICNTMIPHWSTPAERTIIGNTIFAGSELGLFFGNIIPALLIKYSGGGWPAAFYYVGIAGMIWFPLWQMFVYESPEVHPFITDEERQDLQKNSEVKKVKNQLPPAPWKQIILCKEFWAYTIGYIGCNCAYYVMLSGLPRYMGNVVNFPIESNGILSAFPFLVMWLNTMMSAWISDKLIEKQWMSLTNVRKLFTTLSVTAPCIFLLLASYAECDKTMVVMMFIIGITLIGSVYPSLFMNPMDLSPNYAGSLTSVASGISQIVAAIVPNIIGVLVPNSTIDEWRIVFWIIFLSATACNAVYLAWFKAEIQPWNEPKFVERITASVKEKGEVELKLMSYL